MTDPATIPPAVTPFHDLQAYVRLPRLSGLALSPDGSRLVATVAVLDPEGTRLRPALWEVDPAGRRPARQLTRGAKGESSPVFGTAGELFFVSGRPDPDRADPPVDAPAALWRLPEYGEAQVVGTRPGGVGGPVVARGAGTVVVTAATMPAAVSGADDEARRARRRERKVTGILHAGHPVRFWDHDLGPDEPRLLIGSVPNGTLPPAEEGVVGWDDLTPHPGAALREAGYDVTPDGATVVTGWRVTAPEGGVRSVVVAVDVASGRLGAAGDR